MLDYNILSKKKVQKIGNTEYIDLLSDTFNINLKVIGYPLIVNKYYVARPDLISLACYGDDKYADIICKINGISNPFELNENDILYIPSMDYIINCTKTMNPESDIIQPDNNEISNIITSQKKKSEKRSPNEQTLGDNNFIVDHTTGLVFY